MCHDEAGKGRLILSGCGCVVEARGRRSDTNGTVMISRLHMEGTTHGADRHAVRSLRQAGRPRSMWIVNRKYMVLIHSPLCPVANYRIARRSFILWPSICAIYKPVLRAMQGTRGWFRLPMPGTPTLDSTRQEQKRCCRPATLRQRVPAL